jgi:hypothetical protein
MSHDPVATTTCFYVVSAVSGGESPNSVEASAIPHAPPQLSAKPDSGGRQIDYVRTYQPWCGSSLLNGGFEQQEDNAFPNWNPIYNTGSNKVPGTAGSAYSGTGAVKMTGAYTGATSSSWLV